MKRNARCESLQRMQATLSDIFLHEELLLTQLDDWIGDQIDRLIGRIAAAVPSFDDKCQAPDANNGALEFPDRRCRHSWGSHSSPRNRHRGDQLQNEKVKPFQLIGLMRINGMYMQTSHFWLQAYFKTNSHPRCALGMACNALL